jgi:PAS domain S-box-containing protein
MALRGRAKTVLVSILVPVVLYLGILNLADRSSWKTPSDGILWQQVGGGLAVKDIENPEIDSNVQPGNRLLQINGISVRDYDDYIDLLEALTSDAKQEVTADYTFQDSEAEITIPVRVFLKSQLELSDSPVIVVAFVFLLIGLFIQFRHAQATGAFHYFLICLVAFILLLFSYSGRADSFDLTIYWFSGIAFLLLPPMFLHFCYGFVRVEPESSKETPFLGILYFPSLILIAVHAAWFMGMLESFGLPRSPGVSFTLDKIELIHFLAYFVLATIVLISANISAASVVKKQQVRWILAGAVFGILPFGLIYGIPYLLDLKITGWMEASVLSLGLIPLSFGYAIGKYRLPDVDLIFRRGATYLIASSLVLAFFVGMTLLVAQTVANLSPTTGVFWTALAALAVAFIFAPLREKIQDQLDRYFYRDRFRYRQTLPEFARSLSQEISLPKLMEKILTRILRTLEVTQAGIFLADSSSTCHFRLEAIKGRDMVMKELGFNFSETALMDLVKNEDLFGEDQASEERKQVLDSLRENGFYHLEPMVVRGRVIGFIGLGPLTNGNYLTSEDHSMVRSLSDFAAIAFDNALLYRSLELKAGELLQLRIYSESVIENIKLGVAVVSPSGRITVWNSAMDEMTGVSKEQAIGTELDDSLPPDLVDAMREVTDGPDWQVNGVRNLYKTHVTLSSGEGKLLNIILTPFFSEENISTGTLIVVDDITDKIRLENQLQQAEKLSSIGLFAAGVAHEVNTPLTGISSYIQMLIGETAANDPKKQLLEKIERQSFRASEIVNNLLNFARVADTDFEEVQINSLMLEALSLLEHQFRKARIEVKVEVDPTLPKTVGNGGKLQQVFMNLFLNARDAMPDGGSVVIHTFTDDEDVVIEISDTGIGISEENIKRIYDPFFTTKSVGEGTGLGLAVSYGIIQEHSGRISVQSDPGKGTTFSLRLPIRRIN